MDRRPFLAGSFALLATPLAAEGQQTAMPVIGFLSNTSAAEYAHVVAAFRQGLSESGYAEGKNIAIEFRWAEGYYERLPALAADLVSRKVIVITAIGGLPTALAAKAATTTIPIVFVMGGDPVRHGLVASLSRPGSNVTGVGMIAVSLEAKRLELLREMIPNATVIAMLINPQNPQSDDQSRDMVKAAHATRLQVRVIKAGYEAEFEPAFAAVREARASGLVVGADAFFNSRRDRLVALAERYSVPTIYPWREFAVAGGLMTFGPNLVNGYRTAGVYFAKILKGAKPANLPVEQPTKFELVINLKTAKALGLTIPQSLLLRADQVIE